MPPTIPAELSDSEALRELTGLAHRKAGGLDAPWLAQHVLAITAGGDWPLRAAALEAILRRVASAQKSGLRVAKRPKGSVFGSYETRSADRDRRPWITQLRSLTPLVASCDCPDFLRNSLGICKHLVTVVLDAKARARTQQAPALTRPRLAWGPIRPLTGPGDWLERVEWVPSAGARPPVLARLLREPIVDREARTRRLRALDRAITAGALDVDAALPRLVSRELALQSDRAFSPGDQTVIGQHLKTLRHTPYPYQRQGIETFLERGRLLLADDMGLGKTIQAIGAVHVLWHVRKVARVLVVVPASLKAQWHREWQEFTDVPITVVDGTPHERASIFARTKRGVLLANYEQVVRDLPRLLEWRPDLVVLDEAQRIKNWATKTAASVKQLQPSYRLVLTGTPLENRLDELASLFDWVDDLALEPKWRLAPWHSTPTDGRRESSGARHLDTLRERLAGSLLRRRKQDVLGQLPARTDLRVPVELTSAQRAEHDELGPPIVQLVARAKRRPLTQAEFLRLMSLLTTQRMICNGLALARYEELAPSLTDRRPSEALLATLAAPKLSELREVLEQFVGRQGRKVVVFSQWRRMLALAEWATRDVLREAGARAVFFTGQESQKRRTQNIIDLHDDPEVRVLFATDAGGVGLNLQRAATVCVNLELPWNPAVLEQRIGRIHRHGQKMPIDVVNLVCEEGIEARIAALVADKRALFSGLFDGTSDEVRYDGAGSFLTRVEKLVEVEAVNEATRAVDAGTAPEPELDPAPVPAEEPSLIAADSLVPPPQAPVAGFDLASLLSQVHLRQTAEGRVAIEAPREVARSLAGVFGELARLLGEAGSAA